MFLHPELLPRIEGIHLRGHSETTTDHLRITSYNVCYTKLLRTGRLDTVLKSLYLLFNDIDPRSPTPLYEQIAARVRVAVASGDLRPGDALPSVRASYNFV